MAILIRTFITTHHDVPQVRHFEAMLEEKKKETEDALEEAEECGSQITTYMAWLQRYKDMEQPVSKARRYPPPLAPPHQIVHDENTHQGIDEKSYVLFDES